MNEELQKHTAEEIAEAIFDLPMKKAFLVITILAKRMEQTAARAEAISRDKARDDFRRYLGESGL